MLPHWNRLELVLGDITKLSVDAIVNAAHRGLTGGGGVDGAIHRAAGPELRAACLPLAPCETGDAKITPGFRLAARHVIHTVGPIYSGGSHNEEQLLGSCYRRCLEIARDHNILAIAFPAISTGVYGYPFEPATEIAFRTTAAFLQRNSTPARVLHVFFSETDLRSATAILDRLRH